MYTIFYILYCILETLPSPKGTPTILEPRQEFTEAEIEQLILAHDLYDESKESLVIDCHGKTPLHYCIIGKHENVITCF